MNEHRITGFLNEDGTVYDPPRNSLWEKWAQKYPPTPKPEYSQVCDGYSCAVCGRCPQGALWQVPEEDIEEYNLWLLDFNLYMIKHNPRAMSGIGIQWKDGKVINIENITLGILATIDNPFRHTCIVDSKGENF